jgi:hypothetical protein
MQKLDEAKQMLDESNEKLIKLFPLRDAIFVKTMNYIVEWASCKDKNDLLLKESLDLVKLSEEVNEVEGHPKSIFLMDSYLNHVSSAS